jgi:hypothetical protein
VLPNKKPPGKKVFKRQPLKSPGGRENVNKAKKKALVTGNVIMVGVDIAKKKHWARRNKYVIRDLRIMEEQYRPIIMQGVRELFICESVN